MAKKESIASIAAENWMGSHLFGHRYIFFKSLQNTHPKMAQAVMTHYKNFDSRYFQNNKNANQDNESLKYIKQYLDFLEQLIKREQQVELMYMNKVLAELKSNKATILKNSPLGQELQTCLTDATHNIDYIKLTTLLNQLKQDTPLLKQEIQTQIHNISVVQQALEEAPPEINQQIAETYSDNYQTYKQLLTSQLSNYYTHTGEQLQETYSQILQEKIETIMQKAQTPALLQSIVDFLVSKKQTTKAQQEKVLKRLIITMAIKNIDVINIDNKKLDELIEEPLNNINLEDFYTENKKIKNDLTTIEEQALTTGIGLAEKFLQLDEAQGLQLLASYGLVPGTTDKPNVINKYFSSIGQHTKSAAQYRRQFTIALRTAIQNARDQWVATQVNLTKATLEEQTQAWLQYKKQTNNFSYDSLAKCLQINILKAADIGEIQATPEFQQALSDTFKNLKHTTTIPGRRILLKNDIMIAWSWDTQELAKLIKQGRDDNIKKQAETTEKALIKNLERAQHNFISNLNARSKGETNPQYAWETYRNEMYKIADEYLTLYKNLEHNEVEEREKLVDFMNNFIFESTSVKTYEFYHPSQGFKAGSLGGSGRVVDAIPNILKMYQLGGIDTIDQELLIEALLNYGDELLGPSPDIFQHIEAYLLGGAALLLFDDGFANMETFLQLMKQFFQNTTGPRQLHLLYLNNTYYFFSFILQQIYNNLKIIFQDITETIQMHPESIVTYNHLEIHNNIQQPSDNKFTTLGLTTSPERWSFVSQNAQDNVTVSFLFLGGLLDILQNIQNSFVDIT